MSESDIRTLQEIFGITITEAENTYNYYKKDLNAAIQSLSTGNEVRMGPHNKHDQEDSAFAASSNVDSGSCSNPIDLTSGEDDLQKALALSIQEMNQGNTGRGGRGGGNEDGNVSQEDEDLSRALEASLADNRGNMERLGMSYTYYNPLNPHERERRENTPIGLKNIGNTCWFSSVIQSLFYIPHFRDCILSFESPKLQEQLPCIQFVEELQKLFALLLTSNQKYINPKPALDVLHSVFNNASGTQQDVSEFTHKLLEWMEDAFTHSLGKEQPNPIVRLFTGQCVTEGLLNDQAFTNHSQFGAFPVQVESHAHLHDSLEAATVNNEVQQETWFTHLPPVLVLELSRFKYNQTTGQAEKIHDQLSFDLLLHMDRYLHDKCEESRKRRGEVYKLRSKEAELSRMLKSYINYRGKSVSIQDVLWLALQFVSSHDNQSDSNSSSGPVPRTGTSPDVSITGTCLRQWMAEVESEVTELQDKLHATVDSLNSVYADPEMKHTAYRLHAVLVHQGEASGGHYWAYVRKDPGETEIEIVRDEGPLETSRETIQEDMGGRGIQAGSGNVAMPDNKEQEEEMEVDPPAEGKGDSVSKDISLEDAIDTVTESKDENSRAISQSYKGGGLSSSIRNSRTTGSTLCTAPGGKGDWLKCNDISITEVDWEEVKRESFGGGSSTGNGNTSAYCLVYINVQMERQHRTKHMGIADMSDELIKYICDSNKAFIKLLEEYDSKNQQMRDSGGGKSFIKPAKLVRFESPNIEVSTFARKILDASPSDAKRARGDNFQTEIDPAPSQVEIDPLLFTQLEAKLNHKERSLSNELPDSIKEARLLTDFNYATQCGSSQSVRQAILLDMVSNDLQIEGNIGLSMLARKNFVSLLKDTSVNEELRQIRKLYSTLCGACYHCLQAVNCVKRDENWCQALPHVVKSYCLNSDICQTSREYFGLRKDLLGRFRSKTLLEVSRIGTTCFNSGNVSQGLTIGNKLIVPALKELSLHPCLGDEQITERIREDWCQCLDKNALTEDDTDKLADLLVKIVEDYSNGSNMELPETPAQFDTQTLVAQFSNSFKFLYTEIIPET